MGLALVAVFLYAGSMSTSRDRRRPGRPVVRPDPAAVVRHLHDLDGRRDQPRAVRPPRGRGRAGRRLPHRVLQSLKFALFFLAEYINMATVSALATTLFLGGWHAPFWIDHVLGGRQRGLLAAALVLRQGAVLHLHLHLAARLAAPAALRPVHGVRLEAADPDLAGLDRRGRHDPRRSRSRAAIDRSYLLIGDRRPARPVPRAVLRRRPDAEQADAEPAEATDEPHDAFAGGFPVPPMPAGGAVRGARRAADVRATSRTTVTAVSGATEPSSESPQSGAGVQGASRSSSGTRSPGSASPSGRCSRRSSPSSTPSRSCRRRRASTAGTSSTAGPTAWRSASAASCAPGPARPTPSTSRARPTSTSPTVGTLQPRRALRPRLPDQLPALHPVRAVHRGLPDPRADDDQRVRAGRQQPRRPHLREVRPAGPAAARHGAAAARDAARRRRGRLLPRHPSSRPRCARRRQPEATP